MSGGEDKIRKIIQGRIKIRIILEHPFVIQGASYKLIKTMIAETCPDTPRTLPPGSGLLSISPLIDSNGKYLFPYVKGWQTTRMTPPRYELYGDYTAYIGWVGDQAKRKAFQLVECMKKSQLGSVRIEEIIVERATDHPVGQVLIRLRTPAQYAYRPFWGRSVYLSVPTVSRILKPPLQYLFTNRTEYVEIVKNIDYYTGIIDGNWRPVTVMFDKKKTNSWSITGWARIVVGHNAPTKIMEILGIASRMLLYSGTGKSRLNGFGQVDVSIEA